MSVGKRAATLEGPSHALLLGLRAGGLEGWVTPNVGTLEPSEFFSCNSGRAPRLAVKLVGKGGVVQITDG